MFQMTHFALDRIPTLSRTGTVQKLWHTMAGRRHDPARHIPRNGFHHTWTETHRFHRPLSKLKANIIQLRLFLFSSLCDFFILVWCSVTCRIRLRMYYQKHTHFSISLAYSYKMMYILLVVKKRLSCVATQFDCLHRFHCIDQRKCLADMMRVAKDRKYIKMKTNIIMTRNLTHWGRVTHICVSKLTIIGSDNGLSPGRRQAIIWTNDGILLIRTLGTNFSQNLSEIDSFSFKKMHLKMSSAKWRLFLLGLNELRINYRSVPGFVTSSSNTVAPCMVNQFYMKVYKFKWKLNYQIGTVEMMFVIIFLAFIYVWYMCTCVLEVDIQGRNKLLHPTDTVGCNYLSLTLIPASCIQVLIYITRLSQY